MMKNLSTVLIAVLIFQLFSFGQHEAKTSDGRIVILHDDGTWVYADNTDQNNFKVTSIPKLEIPKTTAKDQIITHTGYSLLYNEDCELASWVAYDKFIVDPQFVSNINIHQKVWIDKLKW